MPPKARGGGRKGNSSEISVVSSNFKISVDVRESKPNALKDFFESLKDNFSNCEDTIPMFPEILPVKFRGKSVNLDTNTTLLRWQPESDKPHHGMLTLRDGTSTRDVRAYQKIIPVLDSQSWIRYKERPNQPFFWNFQKTELTTPENQAYVDVLASATVGKLRSLLKSPHFCEFQGAFRGTAKTFFANLEDDFEDFRFTRWFWESLEKNDFGLRVVRKQTGEALTLDQIKAEFKPDDEYLEDDIPEDVSSSEDDSSSDSNSSELTAQSLDVPDENGLIAENDVSLVETSDIGVDTKNTVNIQNRRPLTPKTVGTMSTHSDTTQMSFCEEQTFHAILYDMPVTVMFLEECEGTMDELLEDKSFAPVKSDGIENIWSAWLFQVIATLCQLQNTLRLTHNDLHTCNILQKKTDQEYLSYADSKGRLFKVPTQGQLFHVIDFGRSIFYLNNFVIVSSDYNDGHDAEGMYNFGPIEDPELPKVLPNRSFDLCRLACSLLRSLYPTTPNAKAKGVILTKEDSWEIRETEHPLFNQLWTWLRTKEGESVLEDAQGNEKYPDFDLQKVIAEKVKDALPEAQLNHALFSQYQVTKTEVKQYIQVPL